MRAFGVDRESANAVARGDIADVAAPISPLLDMRAAGSRAQKIRPLLKSFCGRLQPRAKLRLLDADFEIAERPAAACRRARGCPSAENGPLRAAVRRAQYPLIDFVLDCYISTGHGRPYWRMVRRIRSCVRHLGRRDRRVLIPDHLARRSDRPESGNHSGGADRRAQD